MGETSLGCVDLLDDAGSFSTSTAAVFLSRLLCRMQNTVENYFDLRCLSIHDQQNARDFARA